MAHNQPFGSIKDGCYCGAVLAPRLIIAPCVLDIFHILSFRLFGYLFGFALTFDIFKARQYSNAKDVANGASQHDAAVLKALRVVVFSQLLLLDFVFVQQSEAKKWTGNWRLRVLGLRCFCSVFATAAGLIPLILRMCREFPFLALGQIDRLTRLEVSVTKSRDQTSSVGDHSAGQGS